MSLRDKVLALVDVKYETIPAASLPGWDEDVRVRSMSSRERDVFESAYAKDPGDNTVARAVAFCLIDDQGGRIFEDKDIAALGAKHPANLRTVYHVAMKLSKVEKDATDTAEKN